MLRDRKASMAVRSLSSLTGELLLLVTAAVAFTTFAARRLGGDRYPCRGAKWDGSESHGGGGGGGLGVRRESMWRVVVVAGIVTQAPEQHEQVTKGHNATCHTVGRQGREGKATEVKGQQSHRKGTTRSNARRIRDDTHNPQNHNHNAAPNRRRQEKGQMKN